MSFEQQTYDLRLTTDRINRIASYIPLFDRVPLQQNTQIDNIANANSNNSDINSVTSEIQSNSAMTTEISLQALSGPRFTGNISHTNSDRLIYLAYDVDRWLADADNRCQTRKILDDKLKIAEAKLTVHQSIGDAHHVLTVGQLSAETNYDRFKEQCRVIWQHQEKQTDSLHCNNF